MIDRMAQENSVMFSGECVLVPLVLSVESDCCLPPLISAVQHRLQDLSELLFRFACLFTAPPRWRPCTTLNDSLYTGFWTSFAHDADCNSVHLRWGRASAKQVIKRLRLQMVRVNDSGRGESVYLPMACLSLSMMPSLCSGSPVVR